MRTDLIRRARFTHGMRTMQALEHPNITRVHVAEQMADGLVFAVLEFQRARRDGSVAQAQVLPIILALADAIVAVHDLGTRANQLAAAGSPALVASAAAVTRSLPHRPRPRADRQARRAAAPRGRRPADPDRRSGDVGPRAARVVPDGGRLTLAARRTMMRIV